VPETIHVGLHFWEFMEGELIKLMCTVEEAMNNGKSWHKVFLN